MKCPKCSYLAFETGDRCRNCGYDFSLIADPVAPGDSDLVLPLRSPDIDLPASWQWNDKFSDTPTPSSSSMNTDSAPSAPDPVLARAERSHRKLPLFTPGSGVAADEPLIKIPAAPRPPLAVRRTPEKPTPRPVPKPSRPIASAPTLEFSDKGSSAPMTESVANVRARTAARLATPQPAERRAEVSGAGRRLAATALDHLLLGAIDLTVVYFTLRMAGLSMAEWAAVPPIPLAAFLLLVKLCYFCAFTAVGGQTIGKMTARIRVVTADDATLDSALAVRRTLAGALSAALLGLGYLPALIGSEHRALHDRMTGTRVIALPSI